MRTIKIVSDGVVMEVYDEIDSSIEEANQKALDLLKSDKIVTLIGKNSSAIFKPSTVSGINIIDEPETHSITNDDIGEKKEQNNDHVDMIVDSDDE